jgi:hypothetical protein
MSIDVAILGDKCGQERGQKKTFENRNRAYG